MHYYKRNLGDYAKKCGRLTMLQHGAYTLLIDSCYDREQFPTLEEAIDWCWASTTEEIEAVTFVLRKFFTLEGDVYVQNRIKDEVAEYQLKAETNKRIANERETNRKLKSTKRERSVNEALDKSNESPPNQEPITNNHNKQTHTEETLTRKEPTLAGLVCKSLKKLNITGINPSNPTLLALLDAGATVEEFENAAIMAKVRTMNYIIGTVKGQREQAASENFVKGQFKKIDNAWRTNDTKMLEKAKELGVGTSGLSKFDLIAKIDAKLDKMAAH